MSWCYAEKQYTKTECSEAATVSYLKAFEISNVTFVPVKLN